MDILHLNRLALDLVARDFSDGHAPSNGGPTKTSRALAILHLAAHDAYAQVSGLLSPQFGAALPAPPAGIAQNDANGTIALLSAGIRAAMQLYPDDLAFIALESEGFFTGGDPALIRYGAEIADLWINSRKNDGSSLPQTDTLYDSSPGRHRHDPLNPAQTTLGRSWGFVKPFVLTDVALQAPLLPPPALNSAAYAAAYDEVYQHGRNNITQRTDHYRHQAEIGIFWGYDGSNKIGTPPRLYNQVILGASEFQAANHTTKIKVLTAINVAMADAGIAAWYWKYAYDFWRPVVAIREADAEWGGTGAGDGNTLRKQKGDPFWLPLGAPLSNPFPAPKFGAMGANPTPNFPAYPSGHATFGTACFKTASALLVPSKDPADVHVTMVSDEFNGKTTDNLGAVRPKWTAAFTLAEAIEQNKVSRIYLGVHWKFDADGGDAVGSAAAAKILTAFP